MPRTPCPRSRAGARGALDGPAAAGAAAGAAALAGEGISGAARRRAAATTVKAGVLARNLRRVIVADFSLADVVVFVV
jgi:hypothetical protein